MKGYYYDTRISGKLQVQIKKFSQRVTKGFKKPDRKWIGETIYGILKSKDIKLANIGRATRDSIDLKHTVKRLSRNIVKEDISDEIVDSYISTVWKRIKENTVLSIDLSDISKKEAKKMDNLCEVWDGSEAKVSDNGYWLCKVVGKNPREGEVIPLYNELFSTVAEDFESENKQILKAVETLIRYIGDKGIWTLDRGGDRKYIFYHLLDRLLRFITRLVGEARYLETCDGNRDYPINIASRMKLRHKARLEGKEDYRTKTYNIKFGYERVFLPGRSEELKMVVAEGFGEEPMMLLTNVEVRTKNDALQVIESYIARWIVEESFRFIKQSYSLEDIRLQRYNGLKNMVAIVLLVYGFLSLQLLLHLRLRILVMHIYRASKRLYGIPNFPFYALADGIFYFLSYCRYKFTLFEEMITKGKSLQLLLFNNL
jgi:hypothetical protein